MYNIVFKFFFFKQKTAYEMRISDWSSDVCSSDLNNLAIQVHGGAGYTHDFPVEQFYRDNRINAIHEGTHGIQALDLLGRKVLNGEAIAYLDSVIDDRCTSAARSANPDTQEWAKRLRSEEHTSELQSLMSNSYAASS